MNTKERKAWLRIVEAFLAILIIFGAVLVILARQPAKADISEDVYETQRQILDVISKNNELRSEIINTTNTQNNIKVHTAISSMIPASWNFATNICNLDMICANPGNYENRDVYSTEVLITANLTIYNPKKLRFFVWSK